jgi:D-lactate dehydrogenase (cytochrome)
MTDSGRTIKIEIPEIGMPGIKHAAGYYCKKGMDAVDLFVGAEGTLGIVTMARLKLIELPKNILSSVIFFEDELNAIDFIGHMRDAADKVYYLNYNILKTKSDSKTNPDIRCLEFFDAHSLNFLRADYKQIPDSAQAAVWFEMEYKEGGEDEAIETASEFVLSHHGDEQNSWFAFNKTDMQRIKEFRHAVSSKVSEYLIEHKITKVGTDVAVPNDEFVNFYLKSKALVESASLKYIVYGHFGNSHMHLNILPENDREHTTAKKIYREICQAAAKLGGTISAEHGIGKLKREYLIDMFGAENVGNMAAVKKQLDPNLILNRGNIFLINNE